MSASLGKLVVLFVQVKANEFPDGGSSAWDEEMVDGGEARVDYTVSDQSLTDLVEARSLKLGSECDVQGF